MVNGYTFHRNGAKRRGGIRWCCSNKSRGCTAYMVVDEDRSIVDRLAGEHNHKKPKYIVKGEYQMKT
ncbi:hypothetical protein HF086_005606 [Spodoptera exigua]|uniref:FLYWCH-type domain-containing protein n=1 Tax=Spodoptera exigua TaxID=7107 RepID=A0A922SPN5_SPOEX|nr:hypothetical protein HF086_005606 [Spodoptera exigua]